MDLSKYLRPSNRIDVTPREINKRKNNYKNQNKVGKHVDRKNRANQIAVGRKENRAKQLQNRRCMDKTEDESNNTLLEGTKRNEDAKSNNAKKTYGVQNSIEKQNERMKQLQEFQEKKKLKKQEEQKSKIQPFRAGIRGIRTSEVDLYSAIQSLSSGSSMPSGIAGTTGSKRSNRLFVFTGKKDLKTTKKQLAKPGPIHENTRVTRSHKPRVAPVPSSVELKIESPKTSSPVAEMSETDGQFSFKTPPMCLKPKGIKCNTPWPASAKNLTPETADECDEPLKVKTIAPNMSITKMSTNDEEEYEEESRDIVTPLRPPNSVKRCTSTKKNSVPMINQKANILTPKRTEVTFERGSYSDRRRSKAGKSGRKSFADELGLDDILPCRESSVSPMSETFKKDLVTNQKEVVSADSHDSLENSFSGDAKNRLEPRNLEITEFDKKENVHQDNVITSLSSTPTPTEMDVPYFKSLLEKETTKITCLCQEWEDKLLEFNADEHNKQGTAEEKISKEEIEGQIRATIGKAQILMNKKGRFHQFQDLIRNCEFNSGDKKTTCTDLQGFWEMIYVQVELIIAGFSELSDIEKNGWKIPKPQIRTVEPKLSKGVPKKISVNYRSKKSSVNERKPSSNLREMMAAKRREMALAKNVRPSQSELLLSESTTVISLSPQIESENAECLSAQKSKNPELEKVFDGGFFSVQSPVRKTAPALAAKLASEENVASKSLLQSSILEQR